MRRIVRRLAYATVVGVVIFALLHTSPVRRAALRLLESQSSRLLGGDLEAEELDYSLWRLWRGEARLKGVRFRSPAAAVDVSEILAVWSPSSPFRVEIDGPDVRVTPGEDGSAGRAEIPEALLTARILLRQGRLVVGDVLEAESIDAELFPDGADSRLLLNVGRGELRLDDRPIPFGPATAEVKLAKSSLAIERARIDRGGSFVGVSGTLDSLSPLEGEIRFEHRLKPEEVEELAPGLSVDAPVTGKGVARKAPGSAWSVEGSVDAASLSFDAHGPFAVHAPWRFENDALRFSSARIEGYGGRATLDAAIDLRSEERSASGTFEGIDVRRVEPRIASRASGSFEAAWTGWDFETLRGDASLTLRSSRESRGIPVAGTARARLDGGRIDARFRTRVLRLDDVVSPAAGGSLVLEGTARGPLDDVSVDASISTDDLALGAETFALDGSVHYRRSRLRLEGVELRRVGGGVLTANGEAPLREGAGAFRVAIEASHLDLSGLTSSALAGLVSGRASVSGSFSRPELHFDLEAPALSHGDEVSLSLRASARLTGPLESLEGEASIHANDVLVRDVPFPAIDLELESDREVARVEGRLEDGRRLVVAEVRLEAPYPLEATIPIESLPLDELRRVFPELAEAGAELDVSGLARVSLPLREPSEFEYRIEAERVLGVYRGIFLGASAPFVIEGDRHSFAIRDLILVGEDTAIGVDGVLPLATDGGVVLHARGATRLELLRPWFPDAEPEGRANIDLTVEGALPDPWLRGEIGIDDASVRLRGIQIANVTARGDWSDEALRFDDVRGEILGGRFRLRGELPPQLGASAPTRISFEVEDVNPLELLEKDARFEGAEGEVALSGVLEGVGFDPAAWRGRGALGWVFARITGIELRNDGPAPWSFDDGRIELFGLVLSGGEGRIVLDAEARPFDDVPSFRASASGRIDHSISSFFLRDSGVSIEGATDLDVRASAGPEPFSVRGRGSFANARLVVREPRIALENLGGEIDLDERAIVLTRATAEAGGGRVEASGRIDFSSDRTELDFTARAESIRMSYPEGLRSEVSGNLRLAGAPDALRLGGDVTLARALFSRDIRIETEILQSLSRVERVSEAGSFAGNVQLDLRVRAGEAFRIDNNLARMDASVNLAVRGTLEAPEIHGLAAARPGGEFRFGGNTYRIETGRIQLRGYPAESPVLDIKARTAVSGYDIQLVLRGPTENLATELEAPGKPAGAPDPSRADIASLLLTGRTLERVSSEGRAIVGERMASYLGATLADLAELGIGETLPFDIVTVEPSLIARETNPAARFTLGARFAETFSLVYSIGLDDADDQIWLVDYQLPRRTRTQLIRDADNEFTAGLTQNLSFDVHDREDAAEATTQTIASVEVVLRDRPEDVTEDALRERLRVKGGARYDYWKAWDEAERLEEHLRSKGYLESTADVTTRAEGERSDGVELEYRVTAGPRVSFVFRGDELDGSIEKAVTELWNGSSSETFLASDVALLVEGKLYEDRYYTARVEVEAERRSEREVVVSVLVERGPRGRRVELSFTGNESLSRSVLERALPRTSSAAFHELITVKRPRLKQALQVQYATRGFVEAFVAEPEVSFDESAGVLAVAISVTEGRLFRVEGIELEGVESLSEAELRARLSLAEGEPFRVASFVRDRSTVATFYRERGFQDVEVASSVVDRPSGDLGARFVVREGPRVTVERVAISGNVATRESVIRRELALEAGDPVSPSAINETQRKLYELGVFQSADVVVAEPTPADSPQTSRNLNVTVSELPDLEVDYGIRVGTDGSFQVLGEARTPNLFGRAQSAGIRALVGTDENIYRFTYRSPYLLRLRLVTDFFLERKIEEQVATEDAFGFSDRTWTITGQQTRPFGEHLNLQWSYTFKRTVTEIDDPDDFGDLTLEQDRSILTTALVHDSRTSVIRPTGGNLWSVTFQAAPEALGSDIRFLKLFGQLYTFVPVGGDLIWASGLRLGVADSFGQRLAEDDRFQAGGPTSVRGFAQGSLGPIDPLLGVPIGGSGVLVLNQELRFPLFWRFRGVGFWDAGNAFAAPSDVSVADLRHSLGAGLRLELPFGLLRLDWAGVVDPREDEDPWRFVFSLGHAF